MQSPIKCPLQLNATIFRRCFVCVQGILLEQIFYISQAGSYSIGSLFLQFSYMFLNGTNEQNEHEDE